MTPTPPPVETRNTMKTKTKKLTPKASQALEIASLKHQVAQLHQALSGWAPTTVDLRIDGVVRHVTILARLSTP